MSFYKCILKKLKWICYLSVQFLKWNNIHHITGRIKPLQYKNLHLAKTCISSMINLACVRSTNLQFSIFANILTITSFGKLTSLNFFYSLKSLNYFQIALSSKEWLYVVNIYVKSFTAFIIVISKSYII